MMPSTDRLLMFPRLARVVAVRSGQTRTGEGQATQWIADLEDIDSGALIIGALVEGDGRPLVHTKVRPSVGVYQALAGNAHKCTFRPWRWPSCSPEDIASHDLLAEYETITFHVFRSPSTGATFYTVKKPDLHRAAQEEPGAGHVHQERYLQIVAGKDGEPIAFEMLGGPRRMARAGNADDGGKGDFTQIDAETSPNFVAWMAWVTAALTAIAGVSQAEGGPIPPNVIAPFPSLGGDGAPLGDPVPAVDGGEAGPAPVGASVVGAIVTGSTATRGR
jgi:hypothetical protein